MKTISAIKCRLYQAGMRFACNLIKWPKPRVIKGDDALNKMVEDFNKREIKKPMVIMPSFLYKNPLIKNVLKTFEHHLEIRDLINPTVAAVEEIVEIYKKENCDAMVVIGGGSVIDLGKGAAARIAHPRKTINKMKGVLKLNHKLIPLYAVPTTAGSGSEATVCAVITDEATHEKSSINDPHLVPQVAVLDPRLTVSLPPYLTATTGMDALTHAIESYIGNSNTRKTKKDAIQATKLILDNIEEATLNGQNLQARQAMQEAALLAGQAFTRAYVGYVHALAHKLGGQYNVAHGEANAILLPYVLEAYGEKGKRRLAHLASKIGQPDLDILEKIKSINNKLNIPSYVKELKENDLMVLSARAAKEANPLYPVPVELDMSELKKILVKILPPKGTN